TLAQVVIQRRSSGQHDVKDGARILPRHSIDDGRNDSLGQSRARLNTQFSSPGIGQELNVLDALLELVEDGHASFEQRTAILRRLDTPRVGMEKPGRWHVPDPQLIWKWRIESYSAARRPCPCCQPARRS